MTLLVALLLAGGLFFHGVAALGVARMPDFFTRLHAVSKAETLGVLLTLAGLALWSGLTLLTLLYSAFITTLLAYVAWNRGIDIVGAPRASAFLHTIPLFSAALATTILGETIEPYHIVGFALILSGVTLAARPSAKQRAAAGREIAS